MKPLQLVKGLVLFIAAIAFSGPKPAPRPPVAPKHGAPLAEHLARTEAHVHAIDRHLAAAAAHRDAHHPLTVRQVERVRKLVVHRRREPLVWVEYLRGVPGWILLAGETQTKSSEIQRDAENDVTALGDDVDALWAKRKQVQAERMVLWSKIAFRAVADMELSDQPLYRFELKSPSNSALDQQRMEALKAVVRFVRGVDHLANQAEEAVDPDAKGAYGQWHKALAGGRLQMQDKMLLQAAVAMDVYKDNTEAGQMAAGAKQLVELARTIVDSEKALSAADAAEDDDEADAARAQLQQALSDTAGAVASLDQSVGKAASAWGITPIPGTKADVAALPDLSGAGMTASGGSTVVAPTSPTLAQIPGARTVDLLPYFDVKTGVVEGTWTIDHGELASSDPKRSMIQSSYRPPAEYDFIVEASRENRPTGSDVVQLFSHNGHACTWHFGSNSETTGLQDVDGKGRNKTRNPIPAIFNDYKQHTCTVQVRNNGIKTFIDGTLILDYPTDYNELSPNENWTLGDPHVLGLGSYGPIVFHSVKVIELASAAPSADSSPAGSLLPPPADLSVLLFRGHAREANLFSDLAGGKVRIAKPAVLAEANPFAGASVVAFGGNQFHNIPETAFTETAQANLRQFVENGGDLITFGNKDSAQRIEFFARLFGVRNTGGPIVGAAVESSSLLAHLNNAHISADDLAKVTFWNGYEVPSTATVFVRAGPQGHGPALAGIVPVGKGRVIFLGAGMGDGDDGDLPFDKAFFDFIYKSNQAIKRVPPDAGVSPAAQPVQPPAPATTAPAHIDPRRSIFDIPDDNAPTGDAT